MAATAHYDTLVIGAGMSGLGAGIRLAHFEQRVAVLERHTLWGGLNSFYKQGGRRFDVGLHALTNYVPKGTPSVPLTRVLRQLRLRWEDLQLGEQTFSEIRFPDLRLRFSNDFALLEDEVGLAFPHQRDAFARLTREIRAIDAYAPPDTGVGARQVLGGILSDPLLIEALLLPALYYGSARPNDVDWYQFVILFRSLYMEGFARPEGGIRTLLDLFLRRYRELGGELRLGCGVERILVEGGRAVGVRLDDGCELTADHILSSAGYVETLRLCGPEIYRRHVREQDVGRISFLETLVVLDRPPAQIGHEAAVTFFCTEPRVRYQAPEELVDVASGVICSPNNYAAARPLTEGVVRVTLLAAPDAWPALPPERYAAAKQACAERALDAAARFVPDPRPYEVARDAFTPRTIIQYTGHDHGAVYGSPKKRLDGRTPVRDLFVCGTDQGLLGVIGATLSGITMANQHCLVAQRSSS